MIKNMIKGIKEEIKINYTKRVVYSIREVRVNRFWESKDI